MQTASALFSNCFDFAGVLGEFVAVPGLEKPSVSRPNGWGKLLHRGRNALLRSVRRGLENLTARPAQAPPAPGVVHLPMPEMTMKLPPNEPHSIPVVKLTLRTPPAINIALPEQAAQPVPVMNFTVPEPVVNVHSVFVILRSHLPPGLLCALPVMVPLAKVPSNSQ